MAYAAQREREQPSLGGSFEVSSDDQGETPCQSCPESPDVNAPLPSNQPTFNQIIGQFQSKCIVTLVYGSRF